MPSSADQQSPADQTSPTGEQYVLTRETPNGQVRAIVTELAAALRTLTLGGVDITEPYGDDVQPPYANGIVLFPWPNRIRDGLWQLDGKPQQLDITEPKFHNASHGLLRFSPYTLVERTEGSVTLAATVFPQHGFPFRLEQSVTYELTDDGVSVTHDIRNASGAAAPVALGTHPFLRVGDVPSEDLVITLDAGTRFEVDDRLIPTAEVPVDGTVFDLRAGVRVGDVDLNTTFGSLGSRAHRLTALDGRFVELWQDDSFDYALAFATPFPKNGGMALAVAIEPMTVPPNGFNSGEGLRWLEPGERWVLGWGIRASLDTVAARAGE